ncbi:hypothetical protein [Streptomyces sp. 6N106]|uniref:hypothetical protein n=1 Tax=Streptomyces sp. 6N106 TaxID=3457418 RepID=UPI003FD48D9C
MHHDLPDVAPAGKLFLPVTPSVPGQTATESAAGKEQPKRFPYQNGAEAALHLIHKMPPSEFNKRVDLLIKHRDSQSTPLT